MTFAKSYADVRPNENEVGPCEPLVHEERKGVREWKVYSRRGRKGIAGTK